MFVNIHPLKDEFDLHAKSLEASAKSAVERHNPIVKEIHTVETIREVPNDLTADVKCANHLAADAHDRLDVHDRSFIKVNQKADVHSVILDRHEEELKKLTDLVAQLTEERDMNNREKETIIAKLNDYYLEAHPDCFLEHTDGRKTFRNDLLTYKQDMILRQLLAKPEPVREVHTVTKHVQWPTWLIAGILVVVEALHIFGKI